MSIYGCGAMTTCQPLKRLKPSQVSTVAHLPHCPNFLFELVLRNENTFPQLKRCGLCMTHRMWCVGCLQWRRIVHWREVSWKWLYSNRRGGKAEERKEQEQGPLFLDG